MLKVEQKKLQVSVGIIRDSQQRIFITKRRASSYWAGYWEFPGGKIESGETPHMALVRELYEEVGIRLTQAKLLQTLNSDHNNMVLLLHFFLVEQWQGEPYSREGQPCRWVLQSALKAEEFPTANAAIIAKIQQETL